MKHKKKQKKTKITKKVLLQHQKEKAFKTEEPYASISGFSDIKVFLIHNLDFLLLIGFLIFAVYANSLNGAFVSDDVPSYVNNPRIREFGTALATWNWYEITYSVFFALFKLNPIPLHLMSVVLHFFSVASFFIFVSAIFSKRVSMFATLLFSVHPITTESVAWISGANYMVFSIATFLTGTFYLLFRKTEEKRYLGTSVIIFGLVVVLTQAVQALVIFPVLILIDQFLIERKVTWKNAKYLAWFLIPVGFFVLTKSALISYRIEAVAPQLGSEVTSYFISLPYSIYMTARLLFFPDRLSLYHDSEPITPLLQGEMYVVIVLLVAAIIFTWKKHRKIAGLLLISIASFSYMLSPIQVSWFFAERYVYFATAIFSIFLGMLFLKLEKKMNIKNLGIILLVFVVTAYSVRTFIRNNDWKTRKSLWEATARVVPLSARTYNNLGDVYSQEGNMEASVKAFKRAIELDPNYPDAIHNLGYTYFLMGDLELAEENFQKSLELNPNLYQSYFHLGLVEYKRENHEKVKEYLEKVLEINPNHTQAQQFLQAL